jgi:hypothetical protein
MSAKFGTKNNQVSNFENFIHLSWQHVILSIAFLYTGIVSIAFLYTCILSTGVLSTGILPLGILSRGIL